MDIHGNYKRNVWTTSIGNSCRQLTQTMFNQPWILPSQTNTRIMATLGIPISFTLVVDYFGIGYVGREHADNLMSALIMYYEKSQQTGKENYTAV